MCWGFAKQALKKWQLAEAFVLALCSSPIALAFGLCSTYGNWELKDYVKGSDSQAYYFLHASAFPGYSVGLAQRTDGNLLYFTARLLASSGEDTTLGTAAIRPVPLKRALTLSDDHVYASSLGWVAGLRGTLCVLAYNTRTKKTYSGQEIVSLSPFILIGPREHLNQADVEELRAGITAARKRGNASALRAERTQWKQDQEMYRRVLRAELHNSNAEVRQAAHELLLVCGPLKHSML